MRRCDPDWRATRYNAVVQRLSFEDRQQALGLHRRERAHVLATLFVVFLGVFGATVQVGVEQRRPFGLGAGHQVPVYSYALRQAKYQNPNTELALAFVNGAHGNLG